MAAPRGDSKGIYLGLCVAGEGASLSVVSRAGKF